MLNYINYITPFITTDQIIYQIMLCFNLTIECSEYQMYLSISFFHHSRLTTLTTEAYSSLEIYSTKCLSLALSNWLFILALYLWLCFGYVFGYLSAPQLIQIDAFIPQPEIS